MGYPVAYRAAARQLGYATEAFKRSAPSKLPRPANDNPAPLPPPANDNAPPTLGGTGLSGGVMQALEIAAGFSMLGDFYRQLFEQAQFIAGESLRILSGRQVFTPSNWTLGCQNWACDETLGRPPYNRGQFYYQAGPTAVCCTTSTLLPSVQFSSIKPTWLSAGFAYRGQVDPFSGADWLQLHVRWNRTGAVGAVPFVQFWPAYAPVIRPITLPEMPPWIEPVTNPRVEPRPKAKPDPDPLDAFPPPVPPAYRGRYSTRWRGRLTPFDWRADGEPGTPPFTPPPELPRPPAEGEKEKKFNMRTFVGFMNVMRRFNPVTEVQETAQCAWETLPKGKRQQIVGRKRHGVTYMPSGAWRESGSGSWNKGTAATRALYKTLVRSAPKPKPDPRRMAREIYNGFADINWKQFQDCWMKNEVMDFLVANARDRRTGRSLLPSQLGQ